MTVEVEIPAVQMSDIDPSLPERVHPAFIGPDGGVVKSMKMTMEPSIAICVLRNLRCLYWNRAKDMVVFSDGCFCGDMKAYDEVTWWVRKLGEQIEKIVAIINEREDMGEPEKKF